MLADSLTENFLLVDIDSCVRCYACEIACRQEHDLTFETASRWCRIATVGPRRIDEKLHMDFVPLFCFHCKDPLCATRCPNGAISRNDAGLVLIDEKACSGCRRCIYDCPYGCMSYNEQKKTAGHCDLCRTRIEAGLEPSCVQHCIGGALQFVAAEELAERTSGQHTLRMGKVWYVSAKWELESFLE